MAVFWLQHYYALPVIVEHIGMDDEPPFRSDPPVMESGASQAMGANIQQEALPPQTDFGAFPRQSFAMGAYAGPATMDLSTMAAALPDYQNQPYQQHPFAQHFQSPGASNQSLMFQYQQSPQFAGQTAGAYNHLFAQQYSNPYVQGHQPRQQHILYPPYIGAPSGPPSQHVSNPTFLFQQSMLNNPSTTTQQQQIHPSQFPQQAGPAYSGTYGHRTGGAYPLQRLHLENSFPPPQSHNLLQQPHGPVSRTSSNSSLQKPVLRGPPRKPKQSGHALWVGNLPPSTHIIDLKDHFSRDATDDIESVFLISKSNCAFVNYKSETSCAAAMSRFHDSRFQNVRLVCRLRRGSVSTSNAAPLATKPAPESAPGENNPEESSSGEENAVSDSEAKAESEAAVPTEPEPLQKVKEKFFVVKSLTVEDLERSVHSGIWATQSHNESALNQAFQASVQSQGLFMHMLTVLQAADNVYLIFSANKSGEYFGYARMETAIDDESLADLDYQPRPETTTITTAADLPLTIPTQATATAPKGRIIDDSARGTIFWEAETDDRVKDESKTEDEGGDLSAESDDLVNSSASTPQTFGKPFKIKWASTDRLPFYRTRGLRNPWNANREVKIARDGTEIEPSIGRRLVSMFHRPQLPSNSPNSTRQAPPQPPQGGTGPFLSPHGSAPGGMYGRTY